jgi:hypothetical protein
LIPCKPSFELIFRKVMLGIDFKTHAHFH